MSDVSDMDVSDDGGVPLYSLSNPDNDIPAQQQVGGDSQDPARKKCPYYQDPSVFQSPPTILWRIPSTKRRGQPEHNYETPEVKLFDRCVKLIPRNWGCSPTDGLPEMFHASTPYSMAMLSQIRTLSSTFKKELRDVHKSLIEQWRMRVSTLGIQAPVQERSFVTTQVSGRQVNLRFCERQVQENIYGLTLEDAENTLELLNFKRKKAKGIAKSLKMASSQGLLTPKYEPQVRQHEQTSVDTYQQRDVRRRAKEERRRSLQELRQVDRSQALTMANPAVPTQTAESVTPLTLEAMQEHRLAAMTAAGDSHHSQTLPPARPKRNRQGKRVRAMCNALDAQLNISEAGEEQQKRNEREQRSRQVPFEKSAFSSRPTLQQLGEVRDEREMEEKMEMLELAQMGRKPLPTDANWTGQSAGVADNVWF